MSNHGGRFRKKRVYFSQVSNHALRDKKLSLGAKGLYALIQSYITIEDFTLYKNTLRKQCVEGRDAFNRSWSELKERGYLIQHKSKNLTTGQFEYEYELLDDIRHILETHPLGNPHTVNPVSGDPVCINNIDLNNTDFNNTEPNYKKDIRVLPGATRNSPISYDEYNFTSDDKKKIVTYYMKTYNQYMGTEHPRLKPSQWERVDDGLEEIYDKEIDVIFDSPEVNEWKQMIDKHFETEYADCDYNILHFVTDGVKTRRMYETIY